LSCPTPARIAQRRGFSHNDHDASAHDSSLLSFDADFLVNIPERSNVIALIGVRVDFFGRPRELYLVELALR